LQRRRHEDLQRRPLPLADKRLERQHQREARRDEDDEERTDQGQALDHGRASAEVRKAADADGAAHGDGDGEGDHGQDQAQLADRVAEISFGD
jgi:hypothetical protein